MTAKNTKHEIFMQRCIELAKQGFGFTRPNPMVGSVIVCNEKIIGEGYHQQYGAAHAEVNAINSVKNKALLKQSTIYVSLEPCAHYGKTPPCAKLIVDSKIPNVIIGMKDPFAKVNGEGIGILESAGCKVVVGVLEKECTALNKAFITYHTKNRPYIILKWAETLDGFIDIKRNADSPKQPNWITNEACRSLVHKWRTESDAILVGPQTALSDNPKLNVRSWFGNNPTRVVFDRMLRLPNNLHVFDKNQPTIVFNTLRDSEEENLMFIKIPKKDFIQSALHALHALHFQSVFVEGGGEVLQQFIDSKLWDEARVFKGNVMFHEGLKAPTIYGSAKSIEKLMDNYLTIMANSML